MAWSVGCLYPIDPRSGGSTEWTGIPTIPRCFLGTVLGPEARCTHLGVTPPPKCSVAPNHVLSVKIITTALYLRGIEF